MSTNNIRPIRPDDRAAALEKFRSLVEACKAELPLQIELAGTMAKIRREKFKAYIREGFTEAQALELVKAEVR